MFCTFRMNSYEIKPQLLMPSRKMRTTILFFVWAPWMLRFGRDGLPRWTSPSCLSTCGGVLLYFYPFNLFERQRGCPLGYMKAWRWRQARWCTHCSRRKFLMPFPDKQISVPYATIFFLIFLFSWPFWGPEG